MSRDQWIYIKITNKETNLIFLAEFIKIYIHFVIEWPNIVAGRL